MEMFFHSQKSVEDVHNRIYANYITFLFMLIVGTLIHRGENFRAKFVIGSNELIMSFGNFQGF